MTLAASRATRWLANSNKPSWLMREQADNETLTSAGGSSPTSSERRAAPRERESALSPDAHACGAVRAFIHGAFRALVLCPIARADAYS